ncbi:MAG TPA: alginate lyase family protein [Candidatus Sulfotelmatobacter sp.]
MDRRELVDRSRQEFSKRVDVALSRWGYDFADQARSLEKAASGRFWFEPEQVDELLRLISRRVPGQAEQIVARAERICNHHFDLLGYEDLAYGRPINWHLDRVHGKTAPRKPFHRVRYLDFSEAGDSKVTWELNRHQHFVTLAKAYRLTGEERFGREILAQWQSWHEQNAYPIGINWASTLEVGFRTLSWMWTHALLARTKCLNAHFQSQYLRAQAVNGRHLERYLSTYFSPNTHLLGEGVALFFLGTTCSSINNAARWRSLGWKIVLQSAERQVNDDGFYFEQSTYYHVYALDMFLHAALLASANGMSLPAKFERTIERMMEALALLGGAGPPPRFGDDDGGRLFDPTRNREEHLLDPLAAGAILFSRADLKALAGGLREETIWLCGESGVKQWDALDAKAAPVKSYGLTDSGIYVLASAKTNSQLMVKSAPPRAIRSRGHAHADALSICLQSSGHSLLIDPGTCEYVGSGGKRNRYRGTSVHNTLTLDGEDQARPEGPFSWKDEIHATVERWITGETFTLFQGRHNGYERLPQPALHRRWIVSLESGIFMVRDRIEGEGQHGVGIVWRLGQNLERQEENIFRIKNGAFRFAVVSAKDHGWSEDSSPEAWSPAYGLEQSGAKVKFSKNCELPEEFVTLLVPLQDAALPGKLSRYRPENTTDFICAYRYETQESAHTFIFARTGVAWRCGGLSSDAEFVCLTTGESSSYVNVILCSGSYLEVDGKRMLNASQPVGRWELVNGEHPKVF